MKRVIPEIIWKARSRTTVDDGPAEGSIERRKLIEAELEILKWWDEIYQLPWEQALDRQPKSRGELRKQSKILLEANKSILSLALQKSDLRLQDVEPTDLATAGCLSAWMHVSFYGTIMIWLDRSFQWLNTNGPSACLSRSPYKIKEAVLSAPLHRRATATLINLHQALSTIERVRPQKLSLKVGDIYKSLRNGLLPSEGRDGASAQWTLLLALLHRWFVDSQTTDLTESLKECAWSIHTPIIPWPFSEPINIRLRVSPPGNAFEKVSFVEVRAENDEVQLLEINKEDKAQSVTISLKGYGGQPLDICIPITMNERTQRDGGLEPLSFAVSFYVDDNFLVYNHGFSVERQLCEGQHQKGVSRKAVNSWYENSKEAQEGYAGASIVLLARTALLTGELDVDCDSLASSFKKESVKLTPEDSLEGREGKILLMEGGTFGDLIALEPVLRSQTWGARWDAHPVGLFNYFVPHTIVSQKAGDLLFQMLSPVVETSGLVDFLRNIVARVGDCCFLTWDALWKVRNGLVKNDADLLNRYGRGKDKPSQEHVRVLAAIHDALEEAYDANDIPRRPIRLGDIIRQWDEDSWGQFNISNLHWLVKRRWIAVDDEGLNFMVPSEGHWMIIEQQIKR